MKWSCLDCWIKDTMYSWTTGIPNCLWQAIYCPYCSHRHSKQKYQGLGQKMLKNAKLGVQSSIYYRQDDILLVKYKQKANRKPVHLISTGCNADDQLITSRHGLTGNQAYYDKEV